MHLTNRLLGLESVSIESCILYYMVHDKAVIISELPQTVEWMDLLLTMDLAL